MALLEVVLLAGPAFAVGARRQSRTLALIAATGGTPRQARRVVLASGRRARAARRGARAWCSASWSAGALLPAGPALLGHVVRPVRACPGCTSSASPPSGCSAPLLAAVVPAWLASRQDVVAVLAGRRGDRRRRCGRRCSALVLLGVGVAARRTARRPSGNGEILIAASAILAVLGMILLVPVVVWPARPAVRPAAADRCASPPATRRGTAPAPCRRWPPSRRRSPGWSALGIANASDAQQNEATYTPQAARWATRRRLGAPTSGPGEELADRPAPGRESRTRTVLEVQGIEASTSGPGDAPRPCELHHDDPERQLLEARLACRLYGPRRSTVAARSAAASLRRSSPWPIDALAAGRRRGVHRLQRPDAEATRCCVRPAPDARRGRRADVRP